MHDFLVFLSNLFQLELFYVKAYVAVILVSASCGLVGSIIVGNRMAFFSDAMAHCAFAGVTLGMLITLFAGYRKDDPDLQWIIPAIMVSFGGLVGVAIAFVREHTSLTSDTVIGVFFAGAIGIGALLFATLRTRTNFDPEQFLFGSPLFVNEADLWFLLGVFLMTLLFLLVKYNSIVFNSFHPSLANSRAKGNLIDFYLFIVLLSFIVNLSLNSVGVLLINALLVVPAATAANWSRNLRQLFWSTLFLSLTAGILGLWWSREAKITIDNSETIRFGPGGAIVTVSVFLFFFSLLSQGIVKSLLRLKS